MTENKTAPTPTEPEPGPTVTSDPTPAPHPEKPANKAPATEHHTVAAHDPKPDDGAKPS